MTLVELKRRHELGAKQVKTVRVQIKNQLQRECAAYGCHESLAFTTKNRTLCDGHKNARPKRVSIVEQRKKNREKKQRYYAKHGIVFNKQLKRNISSSGLPLEGYTLIYENYKEPLKPLPKQAGYGYYGTLAQTSDREFIQCHICGMLFSNLSLHLRNHKISPTAYKEKFQLMKSSTLASDVVLSKMQMQSVTKKLGNTELPEHLAEYNRKVQSGEIQHAPDFDRNTWSLERRNKEGLCPDQVLEKIKELAVILGHTPSADEFIKHYHHKYYSSILYQHGSYLNAVKKAKLVSAQEIKQPSNERLLSDLVKFHEKYKRIPMKADFQRGILYPRQMYWRRFGSINNARVEAGLSAIMPLPFGQRYEMTPDEYVKYKKGHTAQAAQA